MGKRAILLILVLVMCYGVAMTLEFLEEEDWRRGREEREDWRRGKEGREEREEVSEDWFLMRDSEYSKLMAGDIRVVRSPGGRIVDRPMHIGFITMEPKSLFIPQYLDSSLIIFIRRGEAKVGTDMQRITGGGAIKEWGCLSNSGMGVFQSFCIGGGTNPESILSGFDSEILSSAFNPDDKDTKGTGKSPDSYNLYDRSPDFRNAYGWSVALDETDYAPLKRSGIGLYLVNLTAVFENFLLTYSACHIFKPVVCNFI
ncbi:Vicilin-like seed storage protein [Quillaja saponaria]|uniref:Vicilin-like seed storage protein n=1 Tax=Quillaja saponaria TaxID=32244 RepID=A0AAD7L1W6_QUISA|nr:Vicilin-like seed storage protein [Quillaja saponaria]